MIWTVLWLHGGLNVAQAADPVGVAVVGLHARSQPDHAGQALVDAVDALPSMVAVPPAALAQQVSGSGSRIVTDALQAEGVAMLAEGRVLYEQADLESAKARISEAVISLEAALAGGLDSLALMEALLVQANIAIAMGDSSTAAKAFKQAVRLDPRLTLDPVHYPPKVVQLFGEVRDQVLDVPLGSISLAGVWRDTQVYVDGRLIGTGVTEVNDVVSGRHHVITVGPSGDRFHAIVHVPPGGVAEFAHDQNGRFVGGVATADAERSALTRQLYASLSDTWTDRVVLVAGETGADEVGIQLYEPRTGRFSVPHRADANGDPLGAITALVPRLEGMCGQDGSLSADLVSDEGLSLDINQNPTLSSMLFAATVAPVAGAALNVPGVPVMSQAPAKKRSGQIHWAVWAGAGVVVVGATTAALLLSNSAPQTEGDDVSNGTGTVLVRF